MKRKNIRKYITAVSASVMLIAGLTGCGEGETYDGYVFPEQQESTLTAVSDTYVESPIVFEDDGITERCLAEFSSDNGACSIKKMEHYYDVTLDYENFSPAEIGKAYAETLMEAYPTYHEDIEPYIYENIYGAFPALEDDYTPVWDRVTYLSGTMQKEYWEEIDAYATALSGGTHGYNPDGKISYEEAVTLNFVPEALRGTACSALSLWGSKTATGDPITVRLLDWNLGTEFQMCTMQAVVHAKKAERSYTGISFLGFGNIVSAINNDGVFAAILDVGSGLDYSYDGRKCYTYDLRYALEEFDTAKEVGDFMNKNSANYTWSHNLIITDKNDSFCAEDVVLQEQEKGQATTVLRDADTPLIDNLTWDNPDSLCVVNSFVSRGNHESLWSNANAVRFNKYNEWVASKDSFTLGELKTVLTQEKVNQGKDANEAKVENVRNTGTVQMIIVDYHTGRIQVAFTPETGPTDDVVFTDIGTY